eukprot:gene2366-2925_t
MERHVPTLKQLCFEYLLRNHEKVHKKVSLIYEIPEIREEFIKLTKRKNLVDDLFFSIFGEIFILENSNTDYHSSSNQNNNNNIGFLSNTTTTSSNNTTATGANFSGDTSMTIDDNNNNNSSNSNNTQQQQQQQQQSKDQDVTMTVPPQTIQQQQQQQPPLQQQQQPQQQQQQQLTSAPTIINTPTSTQNTTVNTGTTTNTHQQINNGYSLNIDINTIKEIDLSGLSRITDLSIQFITKYTHLRHLNLSFCTGISNDFIKTLANGGPQDLWSLSLYNTNINDSTLQAIATTYPGIRQLLIGCCQGITETGIKSILKCSLLTTLDVSHCRRLNNNALKIINLPQLTNLNASWCFEMVSSDSCFYKIAKSCPRLSTLQIASSNIPENQLYKVLSEAKRLTTLDISYCPSSITSVESKVFKYLSQIQNLSLSGCSFKEPVLKKIIDSTPLLKELDLSHQDSILWSFVENCIIRDPQVLAHLKSINFSFSKFDKFDLDTLKTITSLNVFLPSLFEIYTPKPISSLEDELPIFRKIVYISRDRFIHRLQEALEKEKELFYKLEYGTDGPFRLRNKDIIEYSHQQLCLLGRLSKISILIEKEKDIRILDYVKGVKVMYISTRIPVKIPKGSIPDTVERLVISLYVEYGEDEGRFSCLLEEGTIPSSVKYLDIDHPLFKHNAKGLIPDTVEELDLGQWSYKPAETDILPSNLKKLSIKYAADESTPLGGFPDSITELSVNYQLETPILPGVLPESLRHLTLLEITFPLEIGSLPSKLETFYVSNTISPQEVITKPGILPESLTKLNFEYSISDFNLDFIPKSSLTHLDINTITDVRTPLQNFSDNIHNIPMGGVPGSCETLKIVNSKTGQEFPKGLLPSGLKTLDIRYCIIPNLKEHDIPIPNHLIISQDRMGRDDLFLEWITKFFSQSESRLQIDFIGLTKTVTLFSLDPSDLYIYYNIKSNSIQEGFISKSKLPYFLDQNFK